MCDLEKKGEDLLCFACENGLTGTKKTCYACDNGLVGSLNSYGDDWICLCSTWYCNCDSLKKSSWLFYCPLCECWFNQSDYLRKTFSDEKTRWVANMVTHYRHNHRSWDKQHRYISAHCKEGTYDIQKAIVNEQAKRQIIRKATDFLLKNKICTEHFAQLQETTKETIALADKKLKPSTS